jgi:hypothetical protein
MILPNPATADRLRIRTLKRYSPVKTLGIGRRSEMIAELKWASFFIRSLN